MNNKVYISGPITNLDLDQSRISFKKAEKYLKSKGYETVNPFDNGVVVAFRCYDIFKRIIELGVQKCTEYVCLEELRYIIRETISAFSETLQKVKIKHYS